MPNPSGNEVAVLPGNGDGTFGEAETFATDGLGPVAVAHADFTGGGEPDLVVANYVSDTVGILLNSAARNGPSAGTSGSSRRRRAP